MTAKTKTKDDDLHVTLKKAHAVELADQLSRYGDGELAAAFDGAEAGDTVEIKVVEDD